MINKILKYPFKGEKTGNNIVIGSLLVIGSILIIPAFILIGYFARTINNAIQDEPAPEFQDYKGLFIDGIKLTGIHLAYILLISALAFPIVFVGVASDSLGLIAFWVYVPIFILFYVGYPVLSYFYGKNLDFREAFLIKKMIKTVLTWKYAKIYLIFLGLQLSFSILQAILIVTLLGAILVPATLFIELVVYAKLLSQLKN